MARNYHLQSFLHYRLQLCDCWGLQRCPLSRRLRRWDSQHSSHSCNSVAIQEVNHFEPNKGRIYSDRPWTRYRWQSEAFLRHGTRAKSCLPQSAFAFGDGCFMETCYLSIYVVLSMRSDGNEFVYAPLQGSDAFKPWKNRFRACASSPFCSRVAESNWVGAPQATKTRDKKLNSVEVGYIMTDVEDDF